MDILEEQTKKKKNRKKGFTLVELIVVLVILAILAAVLTPSLLGYIDKAKNTQVTTNARTAYIAVQSLLAERFGQNKDNGWQLGGEGDPITAEDIENLTSIKHFETIVYGYKVAEDSVKGQKEHYILTQFVYQQDGKMVQWQADGGWKTLTDDEMFNIIDPNNGYCVIEGNKD